MSKSESAHAGKTMNCHHPGHDDLDEPTDLTFEDHGRFVSSPRGEDRHGTRLGDRFESSALRFDCPDCGATFWTCPICTDHLKPDDNDAHTATGWFWGDTSNEPLACHNCNLAEARRQTRGY